MVDGHLCVCIYDSIYGGIYEGLVMCYAMLCYAMLCYAMLCYAMLCHASASANSALSMFST